jgi:glycosyltransferase involved in cell wall biosynthesis
MKRVLTLVRTSPPTSAGSMSAYARMVETALADAPFAVRRADFFDPCPGRSMWAHHFWRGRHARLWNAWTRDGPAHLLDGSMTGWVPRRHLSRTLVTVHDLIPLRQLQGQLPGRPSLPASVLIRRSVRHLGQAAALHAISAATQADVAEWTGRRGIPVIPLPLKSFPAAGTCPLPAPYILHVGHRGTYKNRAGVIATFKHLNPQDGLSLVIAGDQPDPRHADDPRIHWYPHVTDAQLRYLYEQAALLLFPSWYEGFGMPVLEAMAHGCPVVCADTGALPEVAGDAARMAPPGDPVALAAECRLLLNDPQMRRALIEKGYRQAAAFTAARFRRSLLDWYATCLEDSPCTS